MGQRSLVLSSLSLSSNAGLARGGGGGGRWREVDWRMWEGRAELW